MQSLFFALKLTARKRTLHYGLKKEITALNVKTDLLERTMKKGGIFLQWELPRWMGHKSLSFHEIVKNKKIDHPNLNNEFRAVIFLYRCFDAPAFTQLHALNHGFTKFRAAHFCGIGHQSCKIIRYDFIVDRRFHRVDHQIRCLKPTHVTQHHLC